jgi:hypothetical protein
MKVPRLSLLSFRGVKALKPGFTERTTAVVGVNWVVARYAEQLQAGA